MKIYPALDLLDGKCVRLRQGDFNQVTVYSREPEKILQGFAAGGFSNLHLVDLSGARNPSQRQISRIQSWVNSTGLKIQLGGGIRTAQDVEGLLKLGVERVVIGSLAVIDPQLTLGLLKEFGASRITLAFDVRSKQTVRGELYEVATQGWAKAENLDLEDALSLYLEAGLKRVLCTDISRDGMLQGPNLALYQRLLDLHSDLEIQASGGVGSPGDLECLRGLSPKHRSSVGNRQTGLHSAIVGKAFYEKILSPEAQC